MKTKVCAAIGTIRTGFLQVNPSCRLLWSLSGCLCPLGGGAEVGEFAFLGAEGDGMLTIGLEVLSILLLAHGLDEVRGYEAGGYLDETSARHNIWLSSHHSALHNYTICNSRASRDGSINFSFPDQCSSPHI